VSATKDGSRLECIARHESIESLLAKGRFRSMVELPRCNAKPEAN